MPAGAWLSNWGRSVRIFWGRGEKKNVKIFSHAKWKKARRASENRRVALLSTRGSESDSEAILEESPLFIGFSRGSIFGSDVKIVSRHYFDLQRKWQKSAQNHVKFHPSPPKVLADATCGFVKNHTWRLPEGRDVCSGVTFSATPRMSKFFHKFGGHKKTS